MFVPATQRARSHVAASDMQRFMLHAFILSIAFAAAAAALVR